MAVEGFKISPDIQGQVVPGPTADVAVDDVSDTHYQVIKLAVGAAGTANLISTSNPLPISSAGTGALTASSPTAATVGTSTAEAVASNSSRQGLVLTNTSNNTISFGIGAAAVLNSGITLPPKSVWVMDEFTFATGAVNAIASSASSNLAIQEFT